MSDAPPNDRTVDLEASALEELGRFPVCRAEREQSPAEQTTALPELHTDRRCPPGERELLRNQFPSE